MSDSLVNEAAREAVDVFIPGCLHEIFPEEMTDLTIYVTSIKSRIKYRLLDASGSVSLILFVKKTFTGATAIERFFNILQTPERKTCIPWSINSGRHSQAVCSLRENFRNQYDMFVINLSRKSGITLQNTNLDLNRRIYIMWIVKLLLASTQNPPNLSHVTFSCLNKPNVHSFWSKHIECLDIEEVMEVARQTIRDGKHFVCHRAECSNECRAFFHVIDFDEMDSADERFLQDVDDYDVLSDDEDEENQQNNGQGAFSASSEVYHVTTFGLGPSVIRTKEFQAAAGNHSMTEIEIVFGLESVLRAYRVLCKSFYTYLVAGAHVRRGGPQAPNNLSLEAIRNGLKIYLYVGISHYEGIGPHNFTGNGTNFAKCIIANRLNTFWMVKNSLYPSYALAEKQEVLLQLMFRRITFSNTELVNLRCCNLRLEVSAMDRFSDEEMRQVVTILDDPSMPFICDKFEELPGPRDYQIFGSPIQLGHARKFYDC